MLRRSKHSKNEVVAPKGKEVHIRKRRILPKELSIWSFNCDNPRNSHVQCTD